MNLRGNKNTSTIQPKKTRKSRKKKSESVSPKIQTLVEQFTNITASISFRNELNNNKEVSKNISMEDETNTLNLHLSSNSVEMMHTSNLDESIQPLSSQEPNPVINSTQNPKSPLPVMTCITQRNIPITQAKKALSHKVSIT
jgi:hypothetical protein